MVRSRLTAASVTFPGSSDPPTSASVVAETTAPPRPTVCVRVRVHVRVCVFLEGSYAHHYTISAIFFFFFCIFVETGFCCFPGIFVETDFCHVSQAGLGLLSSSDLPVLASQNSRIIEVSSRAWPLNSDLDNSSNKFSF